MWSHLYSGLDVASNCFFIGNITTSFLACRSEGLVDEKTYGKIEGGSGS